jgi:hypothetical protein
MGAKLCDSDASNTALQAFAQRMGELFVTDNHKETLLRVSHIVLSNSCRSVSKAGARWRSTTAHEALLDIIRVYPMPSQNEVIRAYKERIVLPRLHAAGVASKGETANGYLEGKPEHKGRDDAISGKDIDDARAKVVQRKITKVHDHAYRQRCEAVFGRIHGVHKDKLGPQNIRRSAITDAKGRKMPLDLRKSN